MGNQSGLHSDLTFRIIGCAQRVHGTLGPGFPEAVYHRAMCVELMMQKIPFQGEQKAEVFYEGNLCGEFRMDIVVDERVVLELKALDSLSNDHLAQALTYLKATGLHVALLLNFGRGSLETRRVVL